MPLLPHSQAKLDKMHPDYNKLSFITARTRTRNTIRRTRRRASCKVHGNNYVNKSHVDMHCTCSLHKIHQHEVVHERKHKCQRLFSSSFNKCQRLLYRSTNASAFFIVIHKYAARYINKEKSIGYYMNCKTRQMCGRVFDVQGRNNQYSCLF